MSPHGGLRSIHSHLHRPPLQSIDAVRYYSGKASRNDNTATFLSRCGLFRGFDDARLDTLSRAAEDVSFNRSRHLAKAIRGRDVRDPVGAVQCIPITPVAEVVLARLGLRPF
jgi:hypothetical protein